MSARACDVSAIFIAEKRRLNASWAAISRMTGVPEAALRQHHDPSRFQSLSAPVRKDARSDREKVRDVLVERGLSFDQAVILSRMWMAGPARRKATELATGMAAGEAAGHAVRMAIRAARRFGVTPASAGSASAGVGYALTPASVVALSKLAGLGQDHASLRPTAALLEGKPPTVRP
jgi:hypothetical protein